MHKILSVRGFPWRTETGKDKNHRWFTDSSYRTQANDHSFRCAKIEKKYIEIPQLGGDFSRTLPQSTNRNASVYPEVKDYIESFRCIKKE